MFCNNCGVNLKNGEIFCCKCNPNKAKNEIIMPTKSDELIEETEKSTRKSIIIFIVSWLITLVVMASLIFILL